LIARLKAILGKPWRIKTLRPSNIPKPLGERHFTRCGTPHLQNGGTLIAQTGNMVEIITNDRTETMTVDEYNARQLSAKADNDI
jgi:hypothetical protein